MNPLVLIGLLLLALMVPARLHAAGGSQPNILFVLIDDVGVGDFSCTGNPIARTPAIDKFYGESLRFTNFHVSPTCAPTRAALLTGRHEFKNGVTHTIYERERMTLKAATLAESLHAGGYATGIFGKWHLGDEENYRPDRRGFDEVFIHGGGGIGQTYCGSCGDAPGNTYFSPAILHNGVFEKTDGYCTDVFTRQALRWIEAQQRQGHPFFCYLPLNAAHAPLQVPDAYFQRHRGQTNVSDLAAKFYGMIENIDDNFGRLLGRLDELNLANNTLVIFMSDNGGTVGEKIFNAGLRGSKGTPYEGGTRAPSFWRWPAGIQGGRDCGALAAHIDLFPTLAEIAHVNLARKTRRQFEGRSLTPLLRDPNAPWANRLLFTHLGRWPFGQAADWKYRGCAVRDARFTLVNNTELYDLLLDPGQRTNVIARHPAVAVQLRKAYDEWWSGVQPSLENELVIGPQINPFKELYWKQFGGGPDDLLRRQMNPEAKRLNQEVGK